MRERSVGRSCNLKETDYEIKKTYTNFEGAMFQISSVIPHNYLYFQ